MLILNINSYQKQSAGQEPSKSLDSGILRIGRDPSNEWSLSDPDRVLSKQHCTIEFKAGQYVLTDTSTNGVYLNASSVELGKGVTAVLKQGDSIRISDYEITVSIEQSPADKITQETFEPTQLFAEPAPAPAPVMDVPADGGDWRSMLDPNKPPVAVQVPDDAAVETPDFAQAHYDAPSIGMSIPDDWGTPDTESKTSPVPDSQPVSQVPQPIPDYEPVSQVPQPIPDYEPVSQAPQPIPDYEPVSQAPQPIPDYEPVSQAPQPIPDYEPVAKAPQPIPTPEHVAQASQPIPSPQPIPEYINKAPAAAGNVASGTQSPGSDTLLNAFLTGAGIDPNMTLQSSPEQLMTELGGLFRKTTLGLMGVLSARGDIKSEFRLSQTMIRPTENNPLKFSLNIDEAMVALINKKGAGYMTADAAFDEAFNDLKAHQVAVLTGMQSALKSLLKRFDPEKISASQPQARGMQKMLGGQKARYWDDFLVLYKTLSQDAEDDFQNVFGREFAKAYEQQISNQKKHNS
ncbi:MAG: type VI secretion system protein [Paraglaciecola sp.]